MHRIVAYTFFNAYDKIRQFLSSISTQKKIASFFLPHANDDEFILTQQLYEVLLF